MQAIQVNTPSLWIEPKTKREEVLSLVRRTNTTKGYKVAYNELLKFLKGKPVSIISVQDFLIHLADNGKKLNTIRVYAIGIKHFTGVDAGKEIIEGLRNYLKAEKVVIKQAPPLSVNQLSSAEVTENERLLLSVGFFFCLRVGELVRLKKQDFERTPTSYILRIKHSKNYSNGTHNEKTVSASTLEETKNISPMVLLDQYLSSLKPNDYLFAGRGGGFRTERGVSLLIKKTFGEIYSPHSLRSGSITSATLRGATTSQLLLLSGHHYATSLKAYARPTPEDSAVNLIL